MKYMLIEEFIRIWQTSSSLLEVAHRSGMRASYASARASSLRRLGVRLKLFRGTRHTPEQLNAMADEFLPKKPA